MYNYCYTSEFVVWLVIALELPSKSFQWLLLRNTIRST